MDGERQGNGTTGPDALLAGVGVDVDLLRDGRRVMHTTTDSHGVFVFDAPYGSYRVAVRPPCGYVAAPHGVALGKGDTNAHMVASGDFDGDGMADVLWRDDATKALSTWLLRGALPDGFLPQP